MRGTARLALLTVACLALIRPAAAEGDATKGQKVFTQCQACHTLQAGQNRIGPSLAGVIGRKAGSAPGFKYSDAMASANFQWTEDKLMTYLENPKALVPGNKMAFPGLKKPEDRADVIAFLKSTAAK